MKKLETLFNFCNRSALMVNLIIFIVCIGYILWYFHFTKDYVKTNGKILTINNDPSTKSCIEKSKCLLEIGYEISKRKMKAVVRSPMDSNKLSIGMDIPIFYNKNDNSDIILSKKWNILKGALYVSVAFMFFIILTSYLRIYHSDSKIIKWLISVECADTFFSIV